MTLKVEHGGSPAGRTGSSQGSPPAGDPPRGGVSPHGDLRAGRGGPREACNYLSMATGRWGRPLGNLLGTTWKKEYYFFFFSLFQSIAGVTRI